MATFRLKPDKRYSRNNNEHRYCLITTVEGKVRYLPLKYEISQEQLDVLVAAGKAVPYLVFGGIPPQSPQENSNAAWAALGSELGFKYMTVKPAEGKGQRFFTAEKNIS